MGFKKILFTGKHSKLIFLMLWLFFQPPKLPKKKHKKSPNMSENIPFFVWNPLNLKPIWIQKSGQEKNDQNPDTKKVWSLKLKFAVWWSGEQSATMKHRDWCWENWAATSKSVHHKVHQEMNNDKVNLPDSESCLWDFIDQVWRHDKTHEEEIFITIHQWAGLRKTHGIEVFVADLTGDILTSKSTFVNSNIVSTAEINSMQYVIHFYGSFQGYHACLFLSHMVPCPDGHDGPFWPLGHLAIKSHTKTIR